MHTKAELKTLLEGVMIAESQIFLEEIPYAKHLTDSSEKLNNEYYIRHRIETVKRIQMTAKSDSLALFYMIDEDYEAARLWSEYVTEELSHDTIFKNDLLVHGLTLHQIEKMAPFKPTIEMVDFLIGKIHRIGSLPAVAYSIFVEWNSNLYSKKTVEKARKQYSDKHTQGAFEHAAIDDELDHYDMIIDITHRLLQKKNNVECLIDILKEISKYFRLYFTMLYEKTIVKKHRLIHVVN